MKRTLYNLLSWSSSCIGKERRRRRETRYPSKWGGVPLSLYVLLFSNEKVKQKKRTKGGMCVRERASACWLDVNVVSVTHCLTTTAHEEGQRPIKYARLVCLYKWTANGQTHTTATLILLLHIRTCEEDGWESHTSGFHQAPCGIVSCPARRRGGGGVFYPKESNTQPLLFFVQV